MILQLQFYTYIIANMMTMTKRNMNRLITTQWAMERGMLHITLKDRKCNTWIRARTRVTDARERATRRKLQYVGHCNVLDSLGATRLKLQYGGMSKREWRPWLGKRERGRPQMKWDDDINRQAGLTWKWQAQNRDIWKEIGKTYIHKWIEEVWEEEEIYIHKYTTHQ